jgi:hypothetical protein
MENIQAQNEGKIIFSKDPIDPAQPTAITDQFKAGDHIYAVAYMPKAISKYYSGEKGKVNLEIFIYTLKPPLYAYQQDDREEQLIYSDMFVSGSIKENKYLVIDIVPDSKTTQAYKTAEITYKEFGKKFDGPAKFAEALSQLESGENKLKIVLNVNYDMAAEGKLAVSGDGFDAYKQMAQELNGVAANAGADSEKMPEALMHDATAEAQMLAALKKSKDWANDRFKVAEILKLVISDRDWYIRRHEISGAILHRYIRAAVALKSQDGTCGYYFITFQEDYIGGKFQPMKYDGASDRHAINCSNIK